jgi:hypothetical protein
VFFSVFERKSAGAVLFRHGAGLILFQCLLQPISWLQRADFSQDDLEEATLVRLYCEPMRGSIAENQKLALRTPGI